MIKIIEENSHFLVADKPAGVNIHVEDNKVGFIVLLKQQLKIDKLYPVHRLDKDTSGLLLVAKTLEAAGELSALFAQKKVEKIYLAISDKKPKKKQGWVKGDMAKARGGSYKLLRTIDNPAITYFTSTSLNIENTLIKTPKRLFLLKPLTGRSHQLRVTLKSLGASIVGDKRYGGALVGDADRMYLHAYQLSFTFQGREYAYDLLPEEGVLFQDKEFINSLKLL